MKENKNASFDEAIEWIKVRRQFLSVSGIATWCGIPPASLRSFINGNNASIPAVYKQIIISWYAEFVKNPLH